MAARRRPRRSGVGGLRLQLELALFPQEGSIRASVSAPIDIAPQVGVAQGAAPLAPATAPAAASASSPAAGASTAAAGKPQKPKAAKQIEAVPAPEDANATPPARTLE